VREFLDVLAEAKDAVTAEHAAALKAEEQRYKQPPTANGWRNVRTTTKP
jgi:hypothetical protein